MTDVIAPISVADYNATNSSFRNSLMTRYNNLKTEIGSAQAAINAADTQGAMYAWVTATANPAVEISMAEIAYASDLNSADLSLSVFLKTDYPDFLKNISAFEDALKMANDQDSLNDFYKDNPTVIQTEEFNEIYFMSMGVNLEAVYVKLDDEVTIGIATVGDSTVTPGETIPYVKELGIYSRLFSNSAKFTKTDTTVLSAASELEVTRTITTSEVSIKITGIVNIVNGEDNVVESQVTSVLTFAVGDAVQQTTGQKFLYITKVEVETGSANIPANEEFTFKNII